MRVHGEGSFVFERSEVTAFHESPLTIEANGCVVSAFDIVIATHVPIQGNSSVFSASVFQTKIYPYSTYAVRAEIPRGVIPEALFWDTRSPYYYVRIDAGTESDFAIVGGCDHKTGQVADSSKTVRELEEYARTILPVRSFTHRWSGQVIETHDGIPYIGAFTDHQYGATGFAGNGMTFGTLAGIMISEQIAGSSNPWRSLFDPHRKKIMTGALDYLRENIDYPYYMLKDRLRREQSGSPDDLEPGCGKILRVGGRRVAAYRADDGSLSMVSPSCTHMGCQVHWNQAEKTWDCPCHGSRFTAEGAVISGPAEKPLEPVETIEGAPNMMTASDSDAQMEIRGGT
jgi:Rieske Fe-S protein